MPNGRSPEDGNVKTDCSFRSRKRKADVAIHLQDPDEEVAQIEMSRKKQYEQASCERGSCRSPHMLIPTPEKDDGECRSGFSPFDVHRFTPVRASPLPILGFGSKDVVWKNMVLKEHTYVRDKHFMQRHPHLQPKMRAILLDWLMEVSLELMAAATSTNMPSLNVNQIGDGLKLLVNVWLSSMGV